MIRNQSVGSRKMSEPWERFTFSVKKEERTFNDSPNTCSDWSGRGGKTRGGENSGGEEGKGEERSKSKDEKKEEKKKKGQEKRKRGEDRWMYVVTENGEVKEGG